MNTVTSLNPSVDTIPADQKTLKAARKLANQAMVEVNRLASRVALASRTLDASKAMNDAINKAEVDLTYLAQETVVAVPLWVEELREFSEAMAGADEDDQAEMIEHLKEVFNGHTAFLSKKVDALTALAEPVPIADLLEHCEQERTRLTLARKPLLGETEVLMKRAAELGEQREKLTAAIDAVETKSIEEIGRDAVLNLENLTKLKMAPPQVMLVQEALGLVSKLLDDAKETLNFFSLIKSRDKINRDIDACTAGVRKLNAENQKIEDSFSFIDKVVAIEEQYRIFFHEFPHVLDTLKLFEQAHTLASKQPDDNVRAVIKVVGELKAYFETLD